MHYLFAAVFTMVLVGIASLQAESSTESNYLDRFAGSWSGNGHVQKSADSNVWQVSCQVNAESSENRLSIDGSCNAALLVSRKIGANLIYDPATGHYSGTYIGAVSGPASLSGSRNGSAVRLKITWPKPINGDTQAHLTVSNDGNGRLRITVADNLEPGGPIKTTSEIVLSK